MLKVGDPRAHYGVKQNFALRRLPCIDPIPLFPNQTTIFARIAFYIQLWTFALAVVIAARRAEADVFYSRDGFVLGALSLFKKRQALAYEVHRLGRGAGGKWQQRWVLGRVGSIIAVTGALAEDLAKLGAKPERMHVAHDGIREERFKDVPSQAEARREIGWPEDAFIVGYVGRLQTMAMDKGVGTLVSALRHVEGASIALVGGPDDIVETLKEHWTRSGLDLDQFLYAGQVPPDRVPLYLSAFDACAMPFPYNEHFARHASPMKLFEYMASQRPIVASDLPAVAEVVRDGESALLVPPGDANALAAAIVRLRDNPGLRQLLADSAYKRVMSRYTWAERARNLLQHIQR
jgi:glycosyltransferase involved in cell wall biosynthesis